jgi:membrane protein YdbS with pleckstrin-like domain
VERLIQYLDEIEDLFYAAPLIAEQLRRAIQRILFLLGSISLQITGIVLALTHPPLALAVVALLLVGLLFRAVIIPVPQAIAAS